VRRVAHSDDGMTARVAIDDVAPAADVASLQRMVGNAGTTVTETTVTDQSGAQR